jgi:hypothetical protein
MRNLVGPRPEELHPDLTTLVAAGAEGAVGFIAPA